MPIVVDGEACVLKRTPMERAVVAAVTRRPVEEITEVPKPIKTRIKRVLEIDSADPDTSLFVDWKNTGRSSDRKYGVYQVFRVSICLQLMDSGMKQSDAVSLTSWFAVSFEESLFGMFADIRKHLGEQGKQDPRAWIIATPREDRELEAIRRGCAVEDVDDQFKGFAMLADSDERVKAALENEGHAGGPFVFVEVNELYNRCNTAVIALFREGKANV